MQKINNMASKKKKKDLYDAFAGEFKNEAELEEELEQEGIAAKEAEEEHFEEKEKP